MNVVVAMNQPPDPEGNAPARCAVGLLQGLRSHGLEVTALAARPEFAAGHRAPPDLGVEIVRVPPGRRRGPIARIRRPRAEVLEGGLHERVAHAARDADVLHLEETLTGWLDLDVNRPALVHLHYLARADRSLGPPWRRQFRDVLEFDLAERAAIRRHRYLVASSPLVAAELRRRAPHADVVVAPLSLDPQHYAPAPLDGPPIAGMIGTATWSPTRAAVRRLVTRVWPLVRRRVPDARLYLAGRGMSDLVRSTDKSVMVLGEVEAAPDFLRRLSVLLFPLSRGSGMKVKVLESIATGLPVVTTSAGAEGIDADAEVVVDDDDEELAQSTVELLTDVDSRRTRGAAGRAAFAKHYAPAPATEPLVDLYRRMAG